MKSFSFKQSFKVVLNFFNSNFSIFISLVALSVTMNNARITFSNQKLDQLYKNSTTYISNLNKLDLIITNEEDRTASVEKEVIDINVNNVTLYELIVVRMHFQFYLSKLKQFKESGDSTLNTEDEIKNIEAKIRDIEEELEDVAPAESKFSSILSKYYDEEEELNRFKLFYFF